MLIAGKRQPKRTLEKKNLKKNISSLYKTAMKWIDTIKIDKINSKMRLT